MSEAYSGGDLVVELLERLGIDTAFGLTSVHNIPILDAIGRRNIVRFVMARGEMGAGHMADAFARVSGKLPVLMTSTGPGAANAVPALMEARAAGTPLLHITGQIPTKFASGMGTTHDVPDQSAMLASVSKVALRVRTPHEIFSILTKAVTEALTAPRGPVSVEIPIDVQRAAVVRPPSLDRITLSVASPRSPLAPDVARLVEIVRAARRPMLWLGSGARGAKASVLQLLDAGFRAVTSWAGRGIVPEDDERSLGAINGLGMPLVEEFYKSVDLMLVVGSRLRGQETFDFSLKLPKNLVQIDIDPLANGRTYPLADFVLGDCTAALDALASGLTSHFTVDPQFAHDFTRLRTRARREYHLSLGAYASFPKQIRAAMPAGATWVRDATIANSTWGNRLMPVSAPSENVYPVCSAIGAGLPFAIGAAIANAGLRKTVLLIGDGGFALNMTELWTAVQEKLDLVIIVMNDRGYGVIKHIQDALYGGRQFYVNLTTPEIAGIAALTGLPYWKVDRSEDVESTLTDALRSSRTSLIEVDVTAIGPIPPYFPYNQRPQGG
ncbi:MAG: thiamine pyrophosphate-binding protein [Methylobacteriaceae bacterium]|nr:thiamine pyrophosphate-binding protein [Methylobacteriaceae bacterium]